MGPFDRHRQALFEFVSAARHFLWTVLPLQEGGSEHALQSFVRAAQEPGLPAFEKKVLLLETLSVVDHHIGPRLPSLVDRFAADCTRDSHCVSVFTQCVTDVLRYCGVGHPIAQRAIAMIEKKYTDPRFSPRILASDLGVRLSTLDVMFKRETGQTPGERLRAVRLDRSAVLLTTTTKTIKETWVAVGYNDASTFDHHFKARFLTTPRELRRRTLAPTAGGSGHTPTASPSSESPAVTYENITRSILVVDDCESMRHTTANYLSRLGYDVRRAATGIQALEEIERDCPDLVLLDLHMPGMDGLTCLSKLRGLRRSKAPIVVILTADRLLDEVEDDVYALGATIHSKLCDPEMIHSLVVGSLQSLHRQPRRATQ